MKEILFALLAIGIGTALLFYGYRIARVIIPIWAFFTGFTIGAAGVADALQVEFVGTGLGLVAGLVVGIVFALFAYFFYSLAVVLLGATAGYWIGTAFVGFLGADQGFVSAFVGIVLGVVFAILTLYLKVAKLLLVGLTSFAGSAAVVGGLMLLFGQIELSSFYYEATKDSIESSSIWTAVTIILFIFGILAQVKSAKNFVIKNWTTPYGGPKNHKR